MSGPRRRVWFQVWHARLQRLCVGRRRCHRRGLARRRRVATLACSRSHAHLSQGRGRRPSRRRRWRWCRGRRWETCHPRRSRPWRMRWSRRRRMWGACPAAPGSSSSDSGSQFTWGHRYRASSSARLAKIVEGAAAGISSTFTSFATRGSMIGRMSSPQSPDWRCLGMTPIPDGERRWFPRPSAWRCREEVGEARRFSRCRALACPRINSARGQHWSCRGRWYWTLVTSR
mmetsp:Transcript_45245/g.119362  ORF Transcript_45245/g.119362 Transcript_45245/m.119362 type:complete len:230 (-) Transcript_45245:1095-1784(-)